MRNLLIARLCALLLLVCAMPVWASGTIEADSTANEATPWTSLTPNDADDLFHFVIVADRTGGERPGVFPAAMPKINLLEPAFVVSVGDLIEGYTEDQSQLDREWDEFERFVGELETPFFYAAGNHDMSNALMAETWQRRFGPSYYRFVYKDVLFLVLNSELFGMVSDPNSAVPGPWTQEEQLGFIERTLAEHPDPRWTIVIIHQPLWDYTEVRGDWPLVEEMLGERNYTVFAGHFHRYVKHVRNDRKYITLATTGGISSMRGPVYGEFDHIAWVTMTSNGPRIANLLLDGIHDENVVTAASRTAVQRLTSAVTQSPRRRASRLAPGPGRATSARQRETERSRPRSRRRGTRRSTARSRHAHRVWRTRARPHHLVHGNRLRRTTPGRKIKICPASGSAATTAGGNTAHRGRRPDRLGRVAIRGRAAGGHRLSYHRAGGYFLPLRRAGSARRRLLRHSGHRRQD